MSKEGKEKKKGSCLKTILIIIVLLVILVIVASIVGEDEPEKVGDMNVTEQEQSSQDTEEETNSDGEESTAEEQSSEESVFTKGEIAEMNDVQVTLVDYEESTGSEYNTPSEGNVFVLVNFEIANNSDSELAISSMMSFEAYADDYTLNYSLNALMEKSDSTQLDGTIAAGKKMNGWIGYEVPADWSNIEIHFTDNVWSDNKFVFEITK